MEGLCPKAAGLASVCMNFFGNGRLLGKVHYATRSGRLCWGAYKDIQMRHALKARRLGLRRRFMHGLEVVMNKWWMGTLVPAAAVVLVSACGDGDTQTSTGSSGTGSTSSSSSGTAGNSGSGGQGGSTGQGGSGQGGAGQGGAGQGGMGQGGQAASVVANCGTGACTVSANQVCCFNPNAMMPDPILACTAPGQCEVTVGCDGPEDCPGTEVCCQDKNVVSCTADCSMGNVYCHTVNDCPDAVNYKCIQVFGGFVSACAKNP